MMCYRIGQRAGHARQPSKTSLEGLPYSVRRGKQLARLAGGDSVNPSGVLLVIFEAVSRALALEELSLHTLLHPSQWRRQKDGDVDIIHVADSVCSKTSGRRLCPILSPNSGSVRPDAMSCKRAPAISRPHSHV